MRKPEAGRDLYTICRIHKLGRVLVVGDAMIYSDGVDKPVARASLTYSIPPNKGPKTKGLRKSQARYIVLRQVILPLRPQVFSHHLIGIILTLNRSFKMRT